LPPMLGEAPATMPPPYRRRSSPATNEPTRRPPAARNAKRPSRPPCRPFLPCRPTVPWPAVPTVRRAFGPSVRRNAGVCHLPVPCPCHRAACRAARRAAPHAARHAARHAVRHAVRHASLGVAPAVVGCHPARAAYRRCALRAAYRQRAICPCLARPACRPRPADRRRLPRATVPPLPQPALPPMLGEAPATMPPPYRRRSSPATNEPTRRPPAATCHPTRPPPRRPPASRLLTCAHSCRFIASNACHRFHPPVPRRCRRPSEPSRSYRRLPVPCPVPVRARSRACHSKPSPALECAACATHSLLAPFEPALLPAATRHLAESHPSNQPTRQDHRRKKTEAAAARLCRLSAPCRSASARL